MIVVFTAGDDLGCTFLNWSFHWLSGHDHTWQNKKKQWVKIPTNPLTSHNAHLFDKNFCSAKDWGNIIADFSGFNTIKEDFTFFGWKEENYPISTIKLALDKNIKVVCIACDFDRYKILSRGEPFVNPPLDGKYSYIKQSIKKKFSTVRELSDKIDTPGKAREFLSLSMKFLKMPADIPTIVKDDYHEDRNFLLLNFRDLLNDGHKCLATMFKFLKRDIVQERQKDWILINDLWRQFLMPTLYFYDDLPVILSSIINGESLRLKRYELDIFTEAVIQHELMIQYNNRLSVSGLDRFPEDAKDLTQFLMRKNN